VKQDPPEGTRLKQGQTVTIFGSSGPVLVTVPDVTGKTEAQARDLLRRAGLVVGKVDHQTDERVTRGRVISQSVPGGTSVRGATKVDLVVSSGKPVATVPNVVGMSQADAENALASHNLTPQVIQESQLTCTEPAGFVCRQDPPAGAQVTEGSTVTIYVASESAPPSSGPPPSETPSFSPSPTGTST
jgi:serine/threonine-protein kinase